MGKLNPNGHKQVIHMDRETEQIMVKDGRTFRDLWEGGGKRFPSRAVMGSVSKKNIMQRVCYCVTVTIDGQHLLAAEKLDEAENMPRRSVSYRWTFSRKEILPAHLMVRYILELLLLLLHQHQHRCSTGGNR